ncbi:MAG: geranylgeranylglycerol-phosphate geranylgeranyltransferase [Cytophagaceae bacterium]
MIKNWFRRIRYILKIVYRLVRFKNLLILAFSQLFVAVFLVGRTLPLRSVVFDPGLFVLILSTVFIAAGGYVINDYYDIKIDVINKPQRVTVGRYFNRRIAMVAHFVFSALGIALVVFIGWIFIIINFFSSFLLWFYSNLLKRLPFAGNFCVAVLSGLAVFLPSLYFGEAILLGGIYAFFAFFISLIREIIKDMEDMKGDANFGCRTLPIVLGIRKAKKIIYFITALFTGFLVYSSVSVGLTLFLSLLILVVFPVIYLMFRLSRADTIKDYAFLSSVCKFIMLSGLMSMIFIE